MIEDQTDQTIKFNQASEVNYKTVQIITMLTRLNMLAKSSSMAIYLQKRISPIIIRPIGTPNFSYYSLIQFLSSKSIKNIPFALSEYKQQKSENEKEVEIKIEENKANSNTEVKPGDSKNQTMKKLQTKVFLRSDGTVVESKQTAQDNGIAFAIVSEMIGDRKIVGVQTRLQYFLEKIIKVLSFGFILNIFFICFVLSRPEVREKDLQQIRQLKRFF